MAQIVSDSSGVLAPRSREGMTDYGPARGGLPPPKIAEPSDVPPDFEWGTQKREIDL